VKHVPLSGLVQPALKRIEAEGGSLDVLIEQLRPPHALVLVGVSAVSLALAQLGMQLGWVVTLIETRVDAPVPSNLPPAVRVTTVEASRISDQVALDAYTSVVVMSHKLQTDIAFLRSLRDAPVAYLGAIGSRSRVAQIYEATGLSAPRLRAPAGLDVGSETPEEIALSIAAEIVAVAAGREGGALSAVDKPIH
jgi:xanthine/CO dehydrogenase XdhC/CoxF family maturation factor